MCTVVITENRELEPRRVADHFPEDPRRKQRHPDMTFDECKEASERFMANMVDRMFEEMDHIASDIFFRQPFLDRCLLRGQCDCIHRSIQQPIQRSTFHCIRYEVTERIRRRVGDIDAMTTRILHDVYESTMKHFFDRETMLRHFAWRSEPQSLIDSAGLRGGAMHFIYRDLSPVGGAALFHCVTRL